MADDTIIKNLEPYLNQEFEPETYEIEKGMISRFVEAIGDDNPRWKEQAPPTFPAALVPKALLHMLFNVDIPLKRTLNGASELEQLQPIKPGDSITVNAKLTKLRQVKGEEGPTLFMFTEMTYTNQREEVVVKGKNTYIKY